MAIENNDLVVVQKNGGGELRKATVSALLAGVPTPDSSLWEEDGNAVTPKKTGADLNIEGGITAAGATFAERVTSPDILMSGTNGAYLTGDYNSGAFLRLTTVEGKTDEAIRITNGGTGLNYATTLLNYDGSATFAGNVQCGENTGSSTQDKDGTMLTSVGTIDAFQAAATDRKFFRAGKYGVGEVFSVDKDGSIESDGSATFAGTVDIGNNAGSSSGQGFYFGDDGIGYLLAQGDSKGFYIYNGPSSNTISLKSNGSATFAGDVDASNGTGTARLNPVGMLFARASSGNALEIRNTTDPSDIQASIAANGSGTFAGGLNCENRLAIGSNDLALGATANAILIYDNAGGGPKVQIKAGGSATFAGDVDASDGTGITRLNPLGQLYVQSNTGVALDIRSAANPNVSTFQVSGTTGELISTSGAWFSGDVFCDTRIGGGAIADKVALTYGVTARNNFDASSNASAVTAQNFNSAGRVWCGDDHTGTTTSEIYASGSATFAGTVTAGNFDLESLPTLS